MSGEIINSENNNKIKYLRKLYSKRYRKKEGKFIIEGYRIIKEAWKSGANFDSIFMTPEFASSCEGQQIKKMVGDSNIILVEESLFADLADTVNPQGILAVVVEPEYRVKDFLDKSELVLVLDRIQDPGNMGTLIRTALAAGVDIIISLKGSVDIYNLKVLRSTMGAIFSIPVITGMDLTNFKKVISGFKVISADLSGNQYHYEQDYKEPVMLVIGNEANGIRKEILDISDSIVKIPIFGKIDSLNAAVAGGILIYEAAIRKNI